MFQQLLANKHQEVASFEVWLREVWVWSPTKNMNRARPMAARLIRGCVNRRTGNEISARKLRNPAKFARANELCKLLDCLFFGSSSPSWSRQLQNTGRRKYRENVEEQRREMWSKLRELSSILHYEDLINMDLRTTD